ncbi:transglycosylase SLT domain-containing protein [Candidatus Woesearchaeota archaeon]|nr:transglycosylase SLT domain-containing protein [Candidatus Woesearchaeota archaeon]
MITRNEFFKILGISISNLILTSFVHREEIVPRIIGEMTEKEENSVRYDFKPLGIINPKTTKELEFNQDLYNSLSEKRIKINFAILYPVQFVKNKEQLRYNLGLFWLLFAEAGKITNIDPSILAKLGITESNLSPKSRHKKTGAQGIMQIMPIYSKDFDPYNPWHNIMRGAEVLRIELDRTKSLKKALVAYNRGYNKMVNDQYKDYSFYYTVAYKNLEAIIK